MTKNVKELSYLYTEGRSSIFLSINRAQNNPSFPQADSELKFPPIPMNIKMPKIKNKVQQTYNYSITSFSLVSTFHATESKGFAEQTLSTKRWIMGS